MEELAQDSEMLIMSGFSTKTIVLSCASLFTIERALSDSKVRNLLMLEFLPGLFKKKLFTLKFKLRRRNGCRKGHHTLRVAITFMRTNILRRM